MKKFLMVAVLVLFASLIFGAVWEGKLDAMKTYQDFRAKAITAEAEGNTTDAVAYRIEAGKVAEANEVMDISAMQYNQAGYILIRMYKKAGVKDNNWLIEAREYIKQGLSMYTKEELDLAEKSVIKHLKSNLEFCNYWLDLK